MSIDHEAFSVEGIMRRLTFRSLALGVAQLAHGTVEEEARHRGDQAHRRVGGFLE